jgi:predicted nucleic acid-binding Zn ribbon protein
MPTYVYKFVETGETIEVQQAFTDDALTEATHPGTGAVMAVKKVFTPVGVTFKGGGFYKTDSRGGSTSRPAGASAASGGSESASGAAASDSSSSSSDSSSSTSSSSTSTPAASPTPASTATTTARD